MSKKQDELLSSNYDGIKEYDNDLPRWWLGLFFITIVFGVIYAGYFFFGPTSQEQLASDLSAIKGQQKAVSSEETSKEALLSFVKDSSHLNAGKAVFDARCVVCHGPQGQGLVGPNLTDDNWIHGGKITDIRTTVQNGVLEKGMLAWKGVLSPAEIDNVVAYVYSLHGTNPPNPKAPQGDLVARDE